MAAGDITVVGADASTEINTTSSTIQWSDLGGGALAANDLAVVFWEHSSAATETVQPSGFTLIDTQTDGNSVLNAYKKVCTGSESGNLTVTTSVAGRKNLFGIVLRGADDVLLLTKGGDAGTDANHTPPAATPTVSGCGVIIALGEHSGSATTATPPSGYVESVENAITGSGASFGYLAYKGSAGLLDKLTNGVAETPGNIVSNASGTDVTYMTLIISPSAVAFTGSVALTGSGALTLPTAKPTPIQTLAFTGSGSLTFTGATPKLIQTLALAGSGALTFSGAVPALVASAALTGSGTTTYTAAKPAFATSLALAGSGSLTYTAIPKLVQTLALSGSGTLTQVGFPVYIGAVSLSGSGTLTAAGTPTPKGLLGLTGSGTVTLAGNPAFAASLGLSGTGALTFVPVAGFSGSLGLTGSGDLELVGLLVISRDVDLEVAEPYGHGLLYRGNNGYVLLVRDAQGSTLRFEERK